MGSPRPGFGNQPGPVKPVKLDKNAYDKLDAWVEKQENLLDILVPYIKVRSNQYLDQWLTQMISAKSDASAPPEESKSYWLVALAGNLLWAASCFVPGAGVIAREVEGMSSLGKTMYATMQGVGAVVGAGVADHIAVNDAGAPSGKDVVADALNDKRKQMAKVFDHIDSWASTLILRPKFHASSYRELGRDKYLEAVDALLWTSLFPDFGFENYKGMYHRGLNAINGALADFNRQYQTWRDTEQRYAEHDSTTRYGPNRVAYMEARTKYERFHPFRPKLAFY